MLCPLSKGIIGQQHVGAGYAYVCVPESVVTMRCKGIYFGPIPYVLARWLTFRWGEQPSFETWPGTSFRFVGFYL